MTAAQSRRHRVTLFNRGVTDPQAIADVEQLRGDRRAGEFAALRGRHWDAVIDTCGYVPREVRQLADVLRGATSHYTFISSISAYADTKQGCDEDSPLGVLADPFTEEVTGETYGALKAACEREAMAGFGSAALIVRPGLIVGRFDPTDRFSYWVGRVARGGDVLVPGRAARPVQFIDARDLAEWNIRLIERRTSGVFNATGPDYRLTMGALVEACQRISQSQAQITWMPEKFLLDQGVTPWSELPLWVPESDPANAGFMDIQIGKALQHGLTFRALSDTVQDTLSWLRTRPADYVWRAGLSAEREQALLALADV